VKKFIVALAAVGFAFTSARAIELQVGFAEVDITPGLKEEKPVWIAGYGHGRRATTVHDPIMARCAVLSDGERTYAIVGADLIGLQLPEADRIRDALPEIDHFVLGSSHNHEGPDVIGIWGKLPVTRGVDDDYIDQIVEKITNCVRKAWADLKPADAAFGKADDATLLGDSRLPVALDPTLRVLKFTAPDSGKISGLIVQWNCHPEAMGSRNTELTADFPAATVAALQKKHACPLVYLTGAVGGLMAPPDGVIRDAEGAELREGDFEYMRLYGEAVAALADKAIDEAKTITLTPFKSLRRDVYLPVKNPYYRGAFTAGVLEREAFVDSGNPAVPGKPFRLIDTFKTMAIRTEINLLRLGALDVIGIPGEIYPELVYGNFQEPADSAADFQNAPLEKTVDEIFAKRSWMLVGLANDEIGYIIPKRQWDDEEPFAYGRDKSQYGEMNSCSPDVAPILMGALEQTAKLIEAKPLRIMSHNVWYGFTKKKERKAAWLKWMSEQKPDIVALQELNGYTPDQLRQDAAAWGHSHSALLKQDGFPTGLTSRFPITEVQRIREGFHHGLLRCETGGLIVYVIHFHPSDWEFRIREAALLLADIAKLSEEEQGKVILIGDFNGFSPKEKSHLEKDDELVGFFKMLDVRDGSNNLNAGKLDYSGIRAFHDAGYADLVHQYLKFGAPYPGTFPTELRPDEEMGRDRRLDYAFVPDTLAGRVISAMVIRDEVTAGLSDHYPLFIELAQDKHAFKK
jgi:endonuclease/exonuclease/phosphatase family metal-dependent hydrolase